MPPEPPEPLRFIFPTAGSDPVSHWRPPLYPVPWEPTPNDHFYFMRPIGANVVNWPLARYRYGGVFFEDTVHTGRGYPHRSRHARTGSRTWKCRVGRLRAFLLARGARRSLRAGDRHRARFWLPGQAHLHCLRAYGQGLLLPRPARRDRAGDRPVGGDR